MCYYVASKLSRKDIYQIEQDLSVKYEEEEIPEFHVNSGFAHSKLPVVTAVGEFKNLRWGLIPSWVKDWESARKLRIQTLNAIGETIAEKPSYRGAVKAGRFCVVPVNGFYEWHHHESKEKYPHFIYPKNDSLFLMAGIHERWINKEIEEVHDTFSIITTAANQRMEWIHNSKKRMPAILTKEEAKAWLDPGLSFTEKQKLIKPFDDELMSDHAVSRLITSRKENPNQPEVMEPYNYPELSAN